MSAYIKPDDVIDFQPFPDAESGKDALKTLCDRAKADVRWDWKHNNGNVTMVDLDDGTHVFELRLIPCPEKIEDPRR